jgi:hypothetical protein
MMVDPVSWNKPISWTFFENLDTCPRKIEHRLRGVPDDTVWPSYYADVGTIVQKVYEVYFNQGINLKETAKEKGIDLVVVKRVAEKVLTSKWAREVLGATTYPDGKEEADLVKQVRFDVENGRTALWNADILNKPVRSEVRSPGEARGIRIFAFVDFVRKTDEGEEVYDGKSKSRPDADDRQVVWAALTRKGVDVVKGGILYWRQGFHQVDVSTKAQLEFLEEHLDPLIPTIERLKTGVVSLEAKPSDGNCLMCRWNRSCEESTRRVKPPNFGLPDEVGFEDL